MLEYKFDTQLLIEGNDLNEIEIRKYFEKNFDGDSTIIVGTDELIKVHFHTNEPWEVLKYCATLGDIYDVVVENMERQANVLWNDLSRVEQDAYIRRAEGVKGL